VSPKPGQLQSASSLRGSRTPPDARKQLWGKRIDAICSTRFQVRNPRRSIVRAVRFWPCGQLELSYSFRRDISDRVKWCLLEDGGRDVAAVDFQAGVPARMSGGGASPSSQAGTRYATSALMYASAALGSPLSSRKPM
jgi:hypothetical protein